MYIVWWETFLVVIIPLIIIALFCLYRIYISNPLQTDLVREKTPDEVENILETGDLVFIRYSSKHGKIVKIVTDSHWTHTGLVYRRNGECYIIEVADYTGHDHPEHNGLCIIPFDDWVELNDERICGYRKYTGRKSREKLEKQLAILLEKYKDIKLTMALYDWSAILFNRVYDNSRDDKYFCSEFIAALLQELRILNRNYHCSSFSPKKLEDISNYGKTIMFFNINATTDVPELPNV